MRAYNLIYNEFYRDQDLIDERALDDNTLANVAWRKDYFTASRPTPQKGPDIVLPIGDKAPIRTDAGTDVETSIMKADGNYWQQPSASTFLRAGGAVGSEGSEDTSLYADLSQASGISVNEFREFFALQRFAEARSQYGSRFTEYLSYLGVKSSDARLQRPEYLGGGKSNLEFSEVLQTAQDDIGQEQTPVGTLRGR